MRVACLGEVMLELSPLNSGDRASFAMGVAGDTYNTAVMLRRCGVDVAYFTRLGSDPFSADIVQRASAEGIDTSGMLTCGNSLPGLYAIQNSEYGERSFYYWRQNSPSRSLFCEPALVDELRAVLSGYDWLYLSGITVAVMALNAPEAFKACISGLKRKGVSIAFDPNYRPALWPDHSTALHWHETMLRLSDLVLPTFEDEHALWQAQDPQAVIDHVLSIGVDHIVVKCPDAHARVWHGKERAELSTDYCGAVVDTTGAGDAFNAGYLSAMLQGCGPARRLEIAHQTAAKVIAVKGAIP